MPNHALPLVLVAADDQAICDALQFALRLEGLSVHTYREGAELLKDCDLGRAACIILDDRVSRMDGFEPLSQLRHRDMRMPAILLTGHATEGLRTRAATAGVQMVLEKPLLDNVLVNSIRTVLSAATRQPIRPPRPC